MQSKANYRESQRQRYLERKVRETKRRAAVALDDDARAKADAKTADYQRQLKELAKATGLRRKTGREKDNAPPADLDELTDKQLTDLASKFGHDEQALARLEQEMNRRDEAAAKQETRSSA